MAGMAVALGSNVAVAPACRIESGGAPSRRHGCRSRSVARGLGRIPILRTQAKRVANSTTKSSRPMTILAAKAEGQADVTEVQEAAEDLLKKIQESWDKVDDKLAIGGLGFAGVIVLWGSTGLISAIDKLPLIPQFFELVGLLFTGWFIYRYLLFKPDREELLKLVDDTKAKITGQE